MKIKKILILLLLIICCQHSFLYFILSLYIFREGVELNCCLTTLLKNVNYEKKLFDIDREIIPNTMNIWAQQAHTQIFFV